MKDATFSSACLLALYDRISDAEDAIPRLRRFVLDLAVRGKLVEQDASDEPAAELVMRIAQEKAKSKKGAVELPEAGSPETLGKIPLSWAVVPLIGIGSWAIGSGFPKNEQGTGNGPYFFLKVSDMNLEGNEKFINVSNNYIDDAAAKRMRAKIHPAGTIIFPKIGGAIATNKRRILTREAAIDNNCLGIIFASEVNLDWAFLLMTSIDLTEYQVGTAVPALQQGVLEKIAVAVPPVAEQHRIVAKVDELMALCDQLEQARAGREAVRDRLTTASLARLTAPDADAETFQSHARFALQSLPTLTTRPDQIKTLRQTILNLAVRGKLVEQGAADEPASDLLKILQAEKTRLVKDGAIRKQKPSAALSESEEIFPLPLSWKWTRLLDVGATQTGTSPSSARDELFGDFIPFVKPADLDGPEITYDGFGLSQEGLGHSRVAPANSVMMVCIGGTLGKVNCTSRDVCFNQQINSVTPFIGGLHRYISMALKSSYFQDLAWAKAGIGTLPIISKGKWEVLPIPLPPRAEQHRIVAKVDALMTLCDQLEASLTTATSTRSKLLNALLHEALEPSAEELEMAE
jgi:type I restriction enzyme, S subunit